MIPTIMLCSSVSLAYICSSFLITSFFKVFICPSWNVYHRVINEQYTKTFYIEGAKSFATLCACARGKVISHVVVVVVVVIVHKKSPDLEI